jgi:Protein of unknown function (DUF2510)
VSMPPSIPPGWYADPGSPGSSGQRWWSGVGWTEHLAVTEAPAAPSVAVSSPDATSATGELIEDPARDFLRNNRALLNASHVFELATGILIVFNHLILALYLLSLPIAVTALILEIIILRRHRRLGDVTIMVSILHVFIGSVGILYFMFIFIDATIRFVGQHAA